MCHSEFRFFAFLSALFLFAGVLSSQELGGARGTFLEIAKRYEVAEQHPAPAWSHRKDKPLFRMAWFSDMHITSPEGMEYHRKILAKIRKELKPVAVIFSGDNWGIGVDGAERSRTFRLFLNQCLGTPGEKGFVKAIVLPGDNWAPGFETAFSSRQVAFSLGGFRFIAFAPDRGGKKNGCTLHSQESLQWLEDELNYAAISDQPVIYIQHEPLLPPSTLDAPKISMMLDKAPQAFLALGGHLHLDLEFIKGHWRQWVCPSSGISHRPGFKMLSFYPDCVIAQAWEEDPEKKGEYRPVPKYLRAPIPLQCRSGLVSVKTYNPEDVSRRAHLSYQEDLDLDVQVDLVTNTMVDYALRYVIQRTRGKK